MQLHFIVNEYAGNGKSKKLWATLQTQLTISYEVHKSMYAKHIIEIAHNVAQRAVDCQEQVCIMVIGGDGTIHEVINGAAPYGNVVIGVIGAGSGNDFTRGFSSFKIAQEIERFMKNPLIELHDYGVLQSDGKQQLFINNCGIGFDAFVAITANKSNLKKQLNKFGLGKLSYPYFVIQGLFTFKPFELTVLHNGQRKQYQQVWFATVSNQAYFGGGMNLSPTSNTTDGMIELTVVSQLSKWKFLAVFGTVFFGKHTCFKEIEQLSSTDFELQMNSKLPCHADGEKQLLSHGPQQLSYSVKQQAWKLAK